MPIALSGSLRRPIEPCMSCIIASRGWKASCGSSRGNLYACWSFDWRRRRARSESVHLKRATVLWCYLRNSAFKVGGVDYHVSADLTGQANHLSVTIEADIIKQKLPENDGGYNVLNTKEDPYGKTNKRVYSDLSSENPIDLVRYQVANCYMGRVRLINSGGASSGAGLISGRKAFQRPMAEGAALLNAIQDVYLCQDITVA